MVRRISNGNGMSASPRIWIYELKSKENFDLFLTSYMKFVTKESTKGNKKEVKGHSGQMSITTAQEHIVQAVLRV